MGKNNTPQNTYQIFDNPLKDVPTLYFHDYPSYEEVTDLYGDSVLNARALIEIQSPKSIVCVSYTPDSEFVNYLIKEGLLPEDAVIFSLNDNTLSESLSRGNKLSPDKVSMFKFLTANNDKLEELKKLIAKFQIKFLDSWSYDKQITQLAKNLNISSFSYEETLKDSKPCFRDIARELDIPIAPGKEGLTKTEVVDYATTKNIKLVIKPTVGTGGSENFVYNTNNIKELEDYLNNSYSELFIAEDFIESQSVNGRKISLCIRGLIDKNGQVIFQSIGDQIFDEDEISYLGHSYPSEYSIIHIEQTKEIFLNLCQHLYKEYNFYGHLSIDTGINQATNQVFLYEYNLRKGGGTYGKTIADKRIKQLEKNGEINNPEKIFYWDSAWKTTPQSFLSLYNLLSKANLLFDTKTGEGVTLYSVDLLPLKGKFKVNIMAQSKEKLEDLKKGLKNLC